MMNSLSLINAVLLALLLSSPAAAAVSVPTEYRAASVIHTPLGLVYGNSLQQIIAENLNAYTTYIVSAQAQDPLVNLILFPESGTGFLQVPPQFLRAFCERVPPIGWAALPAECPSWNATATPHSTWASCAAQKFGLDVCINYCENTTIPDPQLPAGETKSFNVDVCFVARSGALMAKYRKSHITGTGPRLSQPKEPDAVIFNSSFGVQFSLFTCYDFWFLEPMRTAMKLGVTDFLFPNEMASGPPYFVGPSGQAGWSLAHGVNLVASTSFGTGGAGAYHKGTAMGINPVNPGAMMNTHSVIVSRLPVIQSRRRVQPGRSFDSVLPNAAHRVMDEATTCMYGPPFNGLNFTFPCVEFAPSPGAAFQLHVTNFGVANVTCDATIATATASSHRWFLGAILVAPAATIDTPTSAINAMCFVFHCPDPTTGCMVSDPSRGWETDLQIDSVLVSASFTGGKFSAATTSVYPMIALEQHSNTGNATDVQVVTPRGEDILFRAPTPDDTSAKNEYTVATTRWLSDAVRSSNLLSAGIYATTLYQQYLP